MAVPLVLIHGYASGSGAFGTWSRALASAERKVEDMFIGNYITLNNEVTVDDIANGFEHALRDRGLDGKPFDAIVHSTGMLVLRSWLTNPNAPASRRGLLKHLIGLAPATFGSPIAAKGRSLLGRIFIGHKDPFGPDFLSSGNMVLDNLELASEFTWNLAHRDLIEEKLYGLGNDTPYVFIFDGTNDYGMLAEIFDRHDQEGSDGVVRWSGVALNTRKINLNLGVPKGGVQWSDWSNLLDIPMVPIAGVHHNQIMGQPPQGLIDLVLQALNVNSKEDFDKFHNTIIPASDVVRQGREKQKGNSWQQFVVHAVDNHGAPITDYSIEIIAKAADGGETSLSNFEADVHPYAADNSFRCFHVRLDGMAEKLQGKKLTARIIANTGTKLVGYQGYGSTQVQNAAPDFGPIDLDLSNFDGSNPNQPALFYPFTTTLIEITLNREPLPPVDIFMFEKSS
jgi:pimeloyl-ACP methyl ester carboxylesterase